jgi:flagellum-specific peptidoglycan hydrolase FlgJ
MTIFSSIVSTLVLVLSLSSPIASIPAEQVEQRGLTGIQAEFYQEHAEDVYYIADRLGVSPTVLIAQMGLESGWGRSPSVRDGCNGYFGIKISSRSSDEIRERRARLISNRLGYTVYPAQPREYRTRDFYNGEYIQDRQEFACYRTARGAIAHYAWMISRNPRYSKAFVFSNPHSQVLTIWLSGYASSPRYFNTSSGIIEQITGESPSEDHLRIAQVAAAVNFDERVKLFNDFFALLYFISR